MTRQLRDDPIESLTTLVLALHEDRRLSHWFEGLSRCSAVERRNEILRMREELLASGVRGDERAVLDLRLLADDRIFEAARAAFTSL